MQNATSPKIITALSPKEVAGQLGLCSKTVLSRVRDGSIQPVYRINKRVIRIPQEAIDNYLPACKARPPASGES